MKKTLIPLIAGMTTLTGVEAAVITWDAGVAPITSATDIINDGEAAANLTFTWDVWPSGTSNALAAGGALNFGQATTAINGVDFTDVGGSGAFGYSTGDANLDNLNQYHSAFGNGSDPWVLNIAGLEENTTYKIQIIGINDNRGGGISGRTTQFQDQSGGLASATLTRGTGGSVIGTFTTGAGETAFDIHGLGSSDPGAAGIVVRAVPEPSATALLGLGGMALILRRRK
ncbi:PEP-CTERM sorting domain-containing protein [Rubritalea tangerina]|uniref:PEP-CTERM sorting domain-containing protein n=1 Tax=Rubritalea tangerina TaxID=430798 RepID=A0ABW4Z791_9BACT